MKEEVDKIRRSADGFCEGAADVIAAARNLEDFADILKRDSTT